MTKEKVFSVEMKPSYLCCQDCVMCPYPEKSPDMTMSWEEIEKNLEFIRENFEFERFDFSGGEPTVYKHFFDILEWFKKNLPQVLVNIHTNGIRFSDEEFARKASGHNLRCFVSFHAPTEEVNQKITQRKNHFEKLVLGLSNLTKYNIPIFIDVVLTKINQDKLNELNKALSSFPVKYIEYRLAHLTNKKNLDVYKPDIIGLKEKVIESFKSLSISNVHVRIEHFPNCFFNPGKLKFKDDNYKIIFFDKKNQLRMYGRGHDFESAIAEDKFYKCFKKDEKCVECVFNGECKGIEKEYLEDLKKQKKEIKPIKKDIETLVKLNM